MTITVTIKPNAKHREEVVDSEGGGFTIYTKAPAVEGRANQAALELLAKHFGVSKSQVKLIRGHTSKLKIFEIQDS